MNQEIEKHGNDFEVKPTGGGLVLTKQQKDFASHIGYEVDCGQGGIGINLGLAFSNELASDDILKPTGVKVFFLNEHAIIEVAFDVVELILPDDKMNIDEVHTMD